MPSTGISSPRERLFWIHHSLGRRDIYVMVNFHRTETLAFGTAFATLVDFAQMSHRQLSTFAGTVVYCAEFEVPSTIHTMLDLGEVNDVSEVILNGKPLGVRWWGRYRYDTGEALRRGRNVLEVKVMTTLFNYCQSLRDHSTAARWTRGKQRVPAGLVGPVRLYRVQ
ncbi:MAG: glycosylhydrolase-like jelly roll fold domain-containing protein [Planctomycetota bacterium]